MLKRKQQLPRIQIRYFAHECSYNDDHVVKHIQQAYKPYTISLQNSNKVSMDTTFFLQAEGQDVSYMRALSPIAILSRTATLQNVNVSLKT